MGGKRRSLAERQEAEAIARKHTPERQYEFYHDDPAKGVFTGTGYEMATHFGIPKYVVAKALCSGRRSFGGGWHFRVTAQKGFEGDHMNKLYVFFNARTEKWGVFESVQALVVDRFVPPQIADKLNNLEYCTWIVSSAKLLEARGLATIARYDNCSIEEAANKVAAAAAILKMDVVWLDKDYKLRTAEP